MILLLHFHIVLPFLLNPYLLKSLRLHHIPLPTIHLSTSNPSPRLIPHRIYLIIRLLILRKHLQGRLIQSFRVISLFKSLCAVRENWPFGVYRFSGCANTLPHLLIRRKSYLITADATTPLISQQLLFRTEIALI